MISMAFRLFMTWIFINECKEDMMRRLVFENEQDEQHQ